MSYQHLAVEFPEKAVAVVALGRPEAANALNTRLAEEVQAAFSSLKKDVRVAVLTGKGKHFCAGADLRERRGMDEAAWERQHRELRGARDAILHCPVPVIAAVNGAAMAGGLELALSCDFIYAAKDARFALTEASLGIMPGLGGTQLLPRAIGRASAREMLYTGRVFSAEEAHGWGMVNRVCEPGNLMAEALSCAKVISENAPLSVGSIKAATIAGDSLPLEQALAVELAHYRKLLATNDRKEGIEAFNEKRKPYFTGT